MKVNVVKEGTKYGIICGLLSLLIMYGSWAMGLETFVSVQIFSRFIPYIIVILLIAGFHLRKQNDGILPFAEALKFTFLSYVIVAVLMAIGTYILYNLVDKDLTQKSMQAALDKTRALMEKMGSSKEDIQKAIGRTESKGQTTGIGQILMGTGLGLIWDFVMALLISVCVKKEEKFDN